MRLSPWIIGHLAGGVSVLIAGCVTPADTTAGPSVFLRQADPYNLPGVTVPEANQYHGFDCNNPVHWDGQTVYVFSSTAQPYRTLGPDSFHLLDPSVETKFHNDDTWKGGRWIESTFKDADGRLYAWYHHEQVGICPPKKTTAPQIGAAVSTDNGLHWQDLGIILTMPPDSLNCDSVNDAFSGGNGDFSVILDHDRRYFYIFFGNYHRDPQYQGVCVARMPYADRDEPVGKVRKWHEGRFDQPGLGGQVTPFFRSFVDIHRDNANYFWGPAVHWNTHLRQYVILLNRAKNKNWNQEGVYVTFNPRLDDPSGWSKPVKILEGVHYYPQVIGTDTSHRETDKVAGRTARLFVTGKSRWEIVFLRPGESPAAVTATMPAGSVK